MNRQLEGVELELDPRFGATGSPPGGPAIPHPAAVPPGGSPPRRVGRKPGRKILADCVYLAASACRTGVQTAPSGDVATRLHEISCGFVSAGIWAYARRWRLRMWPDFFGGELQVKLQLQGSITPVFQGLLGERDLDQLSRPVVADCLLWQRQEEFETCCGDLPPLPRTRTFPGAVSHLMQEIDDGIQICTSQLVVDRLEKLKRTTASIAVTALYRSPAMEVVTTHCVDGPIFQLTIRGDATAYRGHLHWSEFDFEAARRIAPMSLLQAWKSSQRRMA